MLTFQQRSAIRIFLRTYLFIICSLGREGGFYIICSQRMMGRIPACKLPNKYIFNTFFYRMLTVKKISWKSIYKQFGDQKYHFRNSTLKMREPDESAYLYQLLLRSLSEQCLSMAVFCFCFLLTYIGHSNKTLNCKIHS